MHAFLHSRRRPSSGPERADTPISLVPAATSRRDSYERLADVFHAVLGEQSLSCLLERIADEVETLIPNDSLTIFSADEVARTLTPVLARDPWAAEILQSTNSFGEGLTGWAVEHREAVMANRAHLDPRVKTVPGTPADEEEALISVPLIARGSVKGALNIYRVGGNVFDELDFHLAKRLGDAAALALDNADKTAALEHQAQTDALTGLSNHRVFHELLPQQIAAGLAAGAPTTVLIVDLDDFKHLNDVHGHGVGDAVLAAAGEVVRAATREGDGACRIGGEEFGVILRGADAAAGVAVATRIQDELAQRTASLLGVGVTASVGIAQSPDHSRNAQELAACADGAMLTAKASGKNRIVIFDGAELMSRAGSSDRGVRTIAHLKMLQSLSHRLSRLNELPQIGEAILRELLTLLHYHACRVYVVEDGWLVPVAHRHEFSATNGEPVDAVPQRVGTGIAGRAAELKTSVFVANALDCDFAEQLPGTDLVDESIIATPLLFGDEVIGVVVVTKLGARAFDTDDVRLIEVVAGHTSVALKNAALYAAERVEAQRAHRLLDQSNEYLRLSHELVEARELEEVARRVTAATARLLVCDSATLWLQPLARGPLVFVAGCGEAIVQEAHLAALRVPEERLRRLHRELGPFTIDAASARECVDAPGRSETYLIAPLRLTGARVGCLVAGGRDFLPEDTRIIEGIADQAQMALLNAEQFSSLEAMFVATVESLANAIEANDEYTSTHTRAITDMALKVGAAATLSADDLKQLEVGALFHDIGKIGVPNDILSKAGPLNDVEWDQIKRHPEIGERILAPIPQLDGVGKVVRHCHERYDGCGYPDGLAGDEIPFASRVILVCDAYHAMTSRRPYRRAVSHEEAIRELAANAGTQFDPDVVALFTRAHGSAPTATRQ